MNIRQDKAVVNRHSSRSASQDIVITLIFKEVRHIKISKHQLIKEKAKAKPAATFKGMTRCMHFIEGEEKKKRQVSRAEKERKPQMTTQKQVL